MSEYSGYTSPNAPQQTPVLPPPPAEPAKTKNSIGLAALIVAVLGIIFAIIPGAAIVGWILLPIAFVLGIVGVAQSGKPKGVAIAAIVTSIVGFFIAVIAFFFMVGTVIDDVLTSDDPVITTPAEIDDGEEAEVGDGAGEPEDAVTDEEEPPAAPDAELGTRDNPVPMGSTISGEDWDITVLSFEADATAQVVESRMFNDEPQDGNVYALIEAEATYTGEDSSSPWLEIDFVFVSESGNTFRGTESMALAPEPSFMDIGELYNGASGTGYEVLEIPGGEDGLLRVSVGFFGKDVFVSTE